MRLGKVAKYGVFSGPYFSAFGLITERYSVPLRIQSEYGKIRTRKTFQIFMVLLTLNTFIKQLLGYSCSTNEQAFQQLQVIIFRSNFQSYKLCNSKYMITSTQITNIRIRSCSRFVHKKIQKLLNSRLLFRKIANFTVELLQNDKQLEC